MIKIMHFNKRERYLINAALSFQNCLLKKTGDFPEEKLWKKLEDKTNRWVWELKEGSITDDAGVGETLSKERRRGNSLLERRIKNDNKNDT